MYIRYRVPPPDAKTYQLYQHNTLIMKLVAIFLPLFTALSAAAQVSNYHQEINEDGKQLVIQIDRIAQGKEFHYSNRFDVHGMSDEEKSALLRRVLDAVHQEEKKVFLPVGVPGLVEAREPGSEVKVMQQTDPFTKSVEEDTVTQRIKVSYLYVRNGEEHRYERTINKEGKTREEIDRLLKETEEELGFSSSESQTKIL